MKRPGKANLIVVLGILCAVLLLGAVFLLQGQDSPAGAVNRFLTAIGNADVDGILANSTFGGEPDDVVRKKWEATLHRTEYFRFSWRIKRTVLPTDDEAVVGVEVFKNFGLPNVTQETVQVEVTKENGGWKVDAKSLSRDLFPALPR